MPSSAACRSTRAIRLFGKVDVHPLGRIRRVYADHEIGHEVAALRQHDRFDRRRLGKRPAALEQRIYRLRQRVFRPLYRLLLRRSAGDAAGKIRKPGAERTPSARAPAPPGKAASSSVTGPFVALCYSAHLGVSNHTLARARGARKGTDEPSRRRRERAGTAKSKQRIDRGRVSVRAKSNPVPAHPGLPRPEFGSTAILETL